jgi:beta-glucosidase
LVALKTFFDVFCRSCWRLAPMLAMLACLSSLPTAESQTEPWMDASVPPAERAERLVAAMTLDEKIEQISLNTGPNPNLPGCGKRNDTRHIEGLPRLHIPTMRLTNGPIGVAGGDCDPNPQTTAVPTALAVAASWDPEVSFRWGQVAGLETRNIAHHVFIAPGLNMGRIGQNGRNFEYFGEDPFLTGVMTVHQIKGVQQQGIQATAKHFVANEQETERQTIDTIVDDRTLHELYLLPFEMAVKDADVASVMCSYPRIGGVFACENTMLLTQVLRTQWGFRGYVMSDRGATKSTAPSIKAGLDLEFNSNAIWFTLPKIKAALAAGEITISDIDLMLKRRFYSMFALGQFDRPITGFTPVDFTAHARTAREIAEQGSVLLKNEKGALPLSARSLNSIALIGAVTFAGAAKLPATGPRGFITVNATHTVTPLDGVKGALDRLGSRATVTFSDGKDLATVKRLAATSDVAIVMAGDISLEGEDRPNLSLPVLDGVDQNALISTVAAANPRTIVVLKNGGPVLMPWLNQVPAVLEAWYPGQEDGNAVADLLFGVVNPSGRLPITFPRAEVEVAGSTPEQWPGVARDGVHTVTYSERLLMGYRWFDSRRIQPLFPFGHGLSYTAFSIHGLEVTPKRTDGTRPITVEFSVQNTGTRPGAEVPQVYLELPGTAGEPPKRLVAFGKVSLAAGEKKKMRLVIDPSATNHPLGYWDSNSQQWVIANGDYRVFVGKSAGAIILDGAFAIERGR